MTNRDRLSKMNVDELVRFFRQTGGCPPKWTFTESPCLGTPDGLGEIYTCENCWSDWLKEEVEEDGNQ